MGTSVGTRVFTQFGWRPAAALSVAWTGFQLFLLFIRGPHVRRYTWFGWEGGFEARKHVIEARKKAAAEAEKMEKEESDRDKRGSIDNDEKKAPLSPVAEESNKETVKEAKEREAFGQSESDTRTTDPGDVV